MLEAYESVQDLSPGEADPMDSVYEKLLFYGACLWQRSSRAY